MGPEDADVAAYMWDHASFFGDDVSSDQSTVLTCGPIVVIMWMPVTTSITVVTVCKRGQFVLCIANGGHI